MRVGDNGGRSALRVSDRQHRRGRGRHLGCSRGLDGQIDRLKRLADRVTSGQLLDVAISELCEDGAIAGGQGGLKGRAGVGSGSR